MANSITLRKQYSTMLDLVYKKSSLTSVLDGPSDLIREGANANEILIPKMSMQGLANYDKSAGYVNGDVTLDYETVKCTYDRGRKFNVDAMDNIESAGVAFGRLAGEFIRTQVVPELDAWRFSQYAQISGITTANGALADGKATLAALRAARNAIEDAEGDVSTCYLFINPALVGMVEDLDTTASKRALDGWAGIIRVPSARFYTKIDLTANGAGGFAKNAQGKAINFMAIDRNAAIQYQKHTVPKIISPDQNQSADAYMYAYRTVGMCDAYENKLKGIYCHHVGE